MAPRESRLATIVGEDADVITYLCGLVDDGLEEGRAEDEIVEDLVELLAAHAIGDDGGNEMLRQVAVEVVAAGPEAPAVSAPPTPPVTPPPSALLNTVAPRHSASSRSSRSSNAPDAESKSPIATPALDPAVLKFIEFMQSLAPAASSEVCQHVISRYGPCDEAVAVLLDTPLETLQQQVEAAAAVAAVTQKVESQAEKAARKAQLSRYAQVTERAHGDTAELKLAPPRLPYQGTRKETLKAQVTRYRDGEARTMKAGEKFIVEQPEEWDGGSKGRVKTKGKRGPGWVG